MKTINSDSWIFKLYAEQIKRTGLWWKKPIVERPTNVCDVGQRAIKQLIYNFFEILITSLFISTVIIMIAVPVLTIGLYFFTDNPFIVVGGDFGMAIFVVEIFVLIAACVMGLVVVIVKGVSYTGNKLGAIQFTNQWIKDKVEGVCTPLNVEVTDDNNS